MNIFQWKEEYSVDHSEIDTQHKRLFQLAGDLHSAMTEGKGTRKTVGAVGAADFSRLAVFPVPGPFKTVHRDERMKMKRVGCEFGCDGCGGEPRG